MRQTLLKRYRTNVTYVLILAAVATANACKSCNWAEPPNRVEEVGVAVHVTGGGGVCQYQASNWQQSVYIEVQGTDPANTNNHSTYTLSSIPASNYSSVQVPSQHAFQITVTVTQLSGVTCQACSKVCGNAVLTKPKWTGVGNFTGPTSGGSLLPVTVTLPDNPKNSDCGC